MLNIYNRNVLPDEIDEDPKLIAFESGILKEKYTEYGIQEVDKLFLHISPILNELYNSGLSTRDVMSLIVEASFDWALQKRVLR